MKLKSFQILISGRVQGVGFRHYTTLIAEKHKLNGWVRNLLDGRVEVVINCSAQVLESVLCEIRQGPSCSKVEQIESIELHTLINNLNCFQILPTSPTHWEDHSHG
ncbi:MAG: acylphosphatase [Bdellovibrionales bacterium]|nr:acylphosphatase [Bdellovibrionales bacterium]